MTSSWRHAQRLLEAAVGAAGDGVVDALRVDDAHVVHQAARLERPPAVVVHVDQVLAVRRIDGAEQPVVVDLAGGKRVDEGGHV